MELNVLLPYSHGGISIIGSLALFNSFISKDLVIPGRIDFESFGVQITSFFVKKTFEAPASVKTLSLCIITSSHPSSLEEFIFITFPRRDVDLISHLPHLISSQIITFSDFDLNEKGKTYPKVSTSREFGYMCERTESTPLVT